MKLINLVFASVIFTGASCGSNENGLTEMCLEIYRRCVEPTRGRAMDQEEWKEMIHACEMKRLNCEWNMED